VGRLRQGLNVQKGKGARPQGSSVPKGGKSSIFTSSNGEGREEVGGKCAIAHHRVRGGEREFAKNVPLSVRMSKRNAPL